MTSSGRIPAQVKKELNRLADMCSCSMDPNKRDDCPVHKSPCSCVDDTITLIENPSHTISAWVIDKNCVQHGWIDSYLECH